MRSLTVRVSRWLSIPGALLLWLRVIYSALRLSLVLAILAVAAFVVFGVS